MADRNVETGAIVAGAVAISYGAGVLAGWGWDWPAKAIGELWKPKLHVDYPTAPVEFGTTPTITVHDGPGGKPVAGALLTYVMVPTGAEQYKDKPYNSTFADGTLKLVFDRQGDWGYRASKEGFRDSDQFVIVVRSPITNGKNGNGHGAQPGSLLGVAPGPGPGPGPTGRVEVVSWLKGDPPFAVYQLISRTFRLGSLAKTYVGQGDSVIFEGVPYGSYMASVNGTFKDFFSSRQAACNSPPLGVNVSSAYTRVQLWFDRALCVYSGGGGGGGGKPGPKPAPMSNGYRPIARQVL